MATPKGFAAVGVFNNFRERIAASAIKVIENEAWDCIGHASLALAASGTVTMEAAVLGTPMVTFYKVTALSWWAGRRLVKVPYLSMVNLIAQRLVVPELIQNQMTAENSPTQPPTCSPPPLGSRKCRADSALFAILALTPALDPLHAGAAG